jgi:hypothetical protein
MIQQALKSEAEGGVLRMEANTESQQPRNKPDEVMEEEDRGGKRASSDRTASDDSDERPKRIKVRHDGSTTVEETSRRQEEEAEESDSSDNSLTEADNELRQHNIQMESLIVNQQREWWLHAIADMCKRCSGANAHASVLENEKKMLEATIRIFEERCREEGQERRRLAELCAKFKAEGRDRNDGDKVAAENRNLEALHETLNSEIERLGQNISALKRKVREDEQRRLDLQNKNTRQEQQIAVLLGENERIKSLQESAPRETNSVTPASGMPNIPEVVLSCLPGKLGQTLGTHIESREFQNTPNFWLL